jgi:uncharacterized DUF497 family protein
MEITWREEKRRLNLRKHGLDFTLAQQVVSDPLAVTVFDRVQDGEERWHTIGAILAGTSFKVVVVVHTYPEPGDENWIHVISLRTADPRERRSYEISHL